MILDCTEILGFLRWKACQWVETTGRSLGLTGRNYWTIRTEDPAGRMTDELSGIV